MITMQVTVNNEGDFANFFVVDEDPELTFVGSSYEEGFKAAYVCLSVGATEDYYPYLSYDMSPDLSVKTITVTGTITISENRSGSVGSKGVGGIKVYLGEDEIAESADDGSFTAVVPKGTTELIVKGDTTVERTVTLSGENDLTDVNIPIIICNYVVDGKIDYRDAGAFVDNLPATADYYVYADLNGDKIVNYLDAGVFVDFISDSTVEYDSLSLD